MKDDTVVALRQPESFSDDPLTEILRAGARQLLGQAIEAEVAAHIEAHADLTEASGRRRIVRHGHMPEREVQTGIGAVMRNQVTVDTKMPERNTWSGFLTWVKNPAAAWATRTSSESHGGPRPRVWRRSLGRRPLVCRAPTRRTRPGERGYKRRVGSVTKPLAMAFKLILSARRKWRKLDGSNQNWYKQQRNGIQDHGAGRRDRRE